MEGQKEEEQPETGSSGDRKATEEVTKTQQRIDEKATTGNLRGRKELSQSLADLHDGMPETVGELAHHIKNNVWMFMEVEHLDLKCQRSRMNVSESLSLIQRPHAAALPGGSPAPAAPPHRGPASGHHCHLAAGGHTDTLSFPRVSWIARCCIFSFATCDGKKPTALQESRTLLNPDIEH